MSILSSDMAKVVTLIKNKMKSERPTLREYLRSRASGEAQSNKAWRAEELAQLESLKTRTTRYVGEDGKERAVLLLGDYETLIAQILGQQSVYRAGSSNAYLDIERMLERDGFAPE